MPQGGRLLVSRRVSAAVPGRLHETYGNVGPREMTAQTGFARWTKCGLQVSLGE
jgi:hypothetical protein